jgi:hypothetical protein
MKYDNVNDAQMRLGGTVIRYNGKPVYVIDVGDKKDPETFDTYIYLNITFPIDGVVDQVLIDDPLLDFSPVPVGYVNYNGGSAYVHRVPIRKWKQGLHRDNLNVEWDTYNGLGEDADILVTSSLARSILNEYPAFDEAIERVRSKRDKSCAFNRKFSLVRSDIGLLWLYYKGEQVGWIEGEQTFVLGNEHRYLQEELEAA